MIRLRAVAYLLLSASLVAQSQAAPTRQATGAPAGTRAKPTLAPQADAGATKSDSLPQRNSTIRGVIRYTDGRPLAGVTVVATRFDSLGATEAKAAISDGFGKFEIPELLKGNYDVRYDHSAMQSIVRRIGVTEGTNTVSMEVPLDSAAGDPSWEQDRWTFLGLALYFLSVIVIRWHNIARSVHEMLEGQLDALETRLTTEVSDPKHPGVVSLRERVTRIREIVASSRETWLPRSGKKLPWRGIWEFLFWSRGRENATWTAIHEIERQFASFLAPPEQVNTYLRCAEAELRQVNKPVAVAVADAIHQSLDRPAADTKANAARIDIARQALLGRAIAIMNAERDSNFFTLMEWQNKASWLILAALLLMAFITAVAGHAVFFLVGAAGGFVSRLMRALKREDVPLDYGASWTTLFLSPLFGALAAWFGIALVTVAVSDKLHLLGDAFTVVRWDNPTSSQTLAIAFLMGFSERLFDAVVSVLERHAQEPSPVRSIPPFNSTIGAPLPRVPIDGTRGGAALDAEAASVTPEGEVDVLATAKLVTPSQPVSGGVRAHCSITLDSPAPDDVPVALTIDQADYALRPPTVHILKGATEQRFDIIPNAGARPGTVKLTAVLGDRPITASVTFS